MFNLAPKNVYRKTLSLMKPSSGQSLTSLLFFILITTLGILIFSPYVSASSAANTDNTNVFNAPRGVDVDQTTGNIIVADTSNHRVQIFSLIGTLLFQFGNLGSGPGEFWLPSSVAIDPISQNIVVVDSQNNRVQVFDSIGNYLFQFGSSGYDPGEFSAPYSVAIDPISRNIIIGDTLFLQIFNLAGNSLYQSDPFSPCLRPGGIAIAPDSHNIIISRPTRRHIEVFNPVGGFLYQFGQERFNTPSGIATDPNTGNIIVSDLINHNVQVFNQSGEFLNQFGQWGEEPGFFIFPRDVAIDSSTGNILVADGGNNRIQVFNSAGDFLFLFTGDK